MVLEDALVELVGKTMEYAGNLATEEATKNAIVMPFISRVLGYDVFNPSEVVPEYICDVGIKKGEKIDYAITRDGLVQMLIEVKKIGEPLTLENASQLVRYFHSSSARIAVLTNGQYWHFYTDLDKPNRMDERPFLRLDLLDIDPYSLPELKKLTRDAFDLESVIAAAEELKYVSAVKSEIAKEFKAPNEDLVRLLARRVYDRPLTARVQEFFKGVTEKAFKQFVNDRVNERLKSALEDQGPTIPTAPAVDPSPAGSTKSDSTSGHAAARDRVETTEDELEGLKIVKAIVASDISWRRVFARDTQSYFGILLDDNNRRPIARLKFDRKVKCMTLFDEHKNPQRVELDSVEDIYSHAEALRGVVKHYLANEPRCGVRELPG